MLKRRLIFPHFNPDTIKGDLFFPERYFDHLGQNCESKVLDGSLVCFLSYKYILESPPSIWCQIMWNWTKRRFIFPQRRLIFPHPIFLDRYFFSNFFLTKNYHFRTNITFLKPFRREFVDQYYTVLCLTCDIFHNS